MMQQYSRSAHRRLFRPVVGVALFCIASYGTAGATEAEVDWPTFGFDSLRTGYNPAETKLDPDVVPRLALAWTFEPKRFDRAANPIAVAPGSVFGGQPVLATGVKINGVATDLVLVGDNNGVFYALKAKSSVRIGEIVWSHSFGSLTEHSGSGQKYLFGVRSAAAIDRTANGGRGAVYIGLNGNVYAMDLATGTELAGWPVALPGPHIATDQGFIHSGINIVNGQLYIGIASFLDSPHYYGRLVRVDTATATVSGLWYTLTGTATPPPDTVSGGGIWNPGSVSVDPDATVGGVYVATGNALKSPNQRKYSEYVVNLSPNIASVVSFASPVLTDGDYDYGSTPVVFQPTGCPTKLLAVKNKTGLLVVETIGTNGVLKVLQSTQIATATGLNGNVAWDPADQLLFVTTSADGPAPFVHGLSALRQVHACGAFSLAWQTVVNMQGTHFPVGPMSSPTVANGVVYFSTAVVSPQVFAVAASNSAHRKAGQLLWQSAPSSGCRTVSSLDAPTVVNGWVYMTCTGLTATLEAFTVPAAAE